MTPHQESGKLRQISNLSGTPFVKMTGSGNDFVVFDERDVPGELVSSPEVVRAICHRFNGIGADGVVLLEPGHAEINARIRYFNSDGSTADLCGNATLCSTTLAIELALGLPAGLTLETGAGTIRGRLRDGDPEIDLQPVKQIDTQVALELGPGELRIGYAIAGVPHAVVLVADVSQVNLKVRGAELRHNKAFGALGANVNFVSQSADGSWHYRTFERGVEGETLACGTGSVATAVLLAEWGLAASPVHIQTSSHRRLTVSLQKSTSDGAVHPSLRGEGRVVFRGIIGELPIDR